MEKVAEHINEMQRIHEEYGAIFDHLFRQHQKSCKQPIDLSPGDLLYYGGVEWLNISDFLGKIKKGLELHAMCFVFKSAVVFLCKERLRQKKKLMVRPYVHRTFLPVNLNMLLFSAANCFKSVFKRYLDDMLMCLNASHKRNNLLITFCTVNLLINPSSIEYL